MDTFVVEIRHVQRISKKVKEKYFPIKPGEFFETYRDGSGHILIIAEKHNTGIVYIGTSK